MTNNDLYFEAPSNKSGKLQQALGILLAQKLSEGDQCDNFYSNDDSETCCFAPLSDSQLEEIASQC